jgi:hypothetical protein
MPEVGAGSTDLMLLAIMILRRVVVEKVCRVDCGTPYDVYARFKIGTLQIDEIPVCWRLGYDLPIL